MSNFFDSNTLVYLIQFESEKQVRANELIEVGGIISVQVLNEFVNVARRKLKLPWDGILGTLSMVRDCLEVVPLTLDIHDRALTIARTEKFRIYDCNIIAAAELSGCDVLYTEDLSHGQRIGGLTICNPFK